MLRRGGLVTAICAPCGAPTSGPGCFGRHQAQKSDTAASILPLVHPRPQGSGLIRLMLAHILDSASDVVFGKAESFVKTATPVNSENASPQVIIVNFLAPTPAVGVIKNALQWGSI